MEISLDKSQIASYMEDGSITLDELSEANGGENLEGVSDLTINLTGVADNDGVINDADVNIDLTNLNLDNLDINDNGLDIKLQVNDSDGLDIDRETSVTLNHNQAIDASLEVDDSNAAGTTSVDSKTNLKLGTLNDGQATNFSFTNRLDGTNAVAGTTLTNVEGQTEGLNNLDNFSQVNLDLGIDGDMKTASGEQREEIYNWDVDYNGNYIADAERAPFIKAGIDFNVVFTSGNDTADDSNFSIINAGKVNVATTSELGDVRGKAFAFQFAGLLKSMKEQGEIGSDGYIEIDGLKFKLSNPDVLRNNADWESVLSEGDKAFINHVMDTVDEGELKFTVHGANAQSGTTTDAHKEFTMDGTITLDTNGETFNEFGLRFTSDVSKSAACHYVYIPPPPRPGCDPAAMVRFSNTSEADIKQGTGLTLDVTATNDSTIHSMYRLEGFRDDDGNLYGGEGQMYGDLEFKADIYLAEGMETQTVTDTHTTLETELGQKVRDDNVQIKGSEIDKGGLRSKDDRRTQADSDFGRMGKHATYEEDINDRKGLESTFSMIQHLEGVDIFDVTTWINHESITADKISGMDLPDAVVNNIIDSLTSGDLAKSLEGSDDVMKATAILVQVLTSNVDINSNAAVKNYLLDNIGSTEGTTDNNFADTLMLNFINGSDFTVDQADGSSYQMAENFLNDNMGDLNVQNFVINNLNNTSLADNGMRIDAGLRTYVLLNVDEGSDLENLIQSTLYDEIVKSKNGQRGSVFQFFVEIVNPDNNDSQFLDFPEGISIDQILGSGLPEPDGSVNRVGNRLQRLVMDVAKKLMENKKPVGGAISLASQFELYTGTKPEELLNKDRL